MEKEDILKLFGVYENFVEKLLENLKTLNSKSEVSQSFADYDNEYWNELFTNMHSSLAEYFVQVSDFLSDKEIVAVLDSTQVIGVLLSLFSEVSRFLVSTLNSIQNAPGKMIEIMQNFKSILDNITNCKQANDYNQFSNAVVTLFTKYFEKNLEQKEIFGFSVVKFIIKQSTLDCRKKHVTLLWKLRESVGSQFLSNINLKLLDDMFENTKFFNFADGIRFGAHLFRLSSRIALQLHEIVKIELCNCRSNHAFHLGDVYLKAWLNSIGDVKKTIEHDCIQDIMKIAILGDRKNQLQIVLNYHKFLSRFHENIIHKSTNFLIQDLYRPILWQYLDVCNCYVRLNAACIAFDCLPLVNPRLNLIEMNEDMDKQIEKMISVLQDNEVDIRLVATKGTPDALSRVWSFIKPHQIKNWIKIIFNQCVPDSASARIRSAAISSITLLTQHPEMYPYCETHIPKLHDRFYDQSNEVRISMGKFLNSVKDLDQIKISSIVKFDEILERLANDNCQTYVSIICHVLHEAIFPIERERQLEKCLSLIKRNQQASRVFYSNLTSMVGEKEIVHFITYICKGVYVYSKRNLVEDSDSDSSFELHDLNNPITIAALFNIITILYVSIYEKLNTDKNRHLSETLEDKLESYLPIFALEFNATKVWSDFLLLASVVSSGQYVENLDKKCMNEIINQDNHAMEKLFIPYVLCLYYQGKIEEVLNQMLSWITCAHEKFEQDILSPRKRKRVQLAYGNSKPLLAIRCIQAILNRKPEILSENRDSFLNIFNRLTFTKEAINSDVNKIEVNITKDIIKEGFELYCQLCLLLHEEDHFDCNKTLVDLMTWSSNLLLSETMVEKNAPSVENNLSHELLHSALEIITKCLTDSLTIGNISADLTNLVTKYCKNILEKNMNLKLSITYYNTIFRESVNFILYSDEIDLKAETTSETVSNLLSSMLRRSMREEMLQTDFKLFLPILKKTLITQIKKILKRVDWSVLVICDLLWTVFSQTVNLVKKVDDMEDLEQFEMSPLSTTIFEVITSTSLNDIFIAEMELLLSNEEVVKDIPSCYAGFFMVKYLYGDMHNVLRHSDKLKTVVEALKKDSDRLLSQIENDNITKDEKDRQRQFLQRLKLFLENCKPGNLESSASSEDIFV